MVTTEEVVSKPMSCRNCGQIGHVHRDCPHPITSFGIICYRITQLNTIEYLMIQRKDSLSFMEFIRGKYEIDHDDYIKVLLSAMTITERNLLLHKDFEYLWNYVWYQTSIPKHTSEFNIAKKKFDIIKTKLSNLLDNSLSIFVDPEWGFPKGRRKIREDDVDCAIREFDEETGIGANNIKLIKSLLPFEEIFYGTNKILYRHVYYVATTEYNTNSLVVDPRNYNQAREVRAISWLSYKDSLYKIRDHNQERKKLFAEVNNKIENLIKNETMI
jgi:ADP-ribose pyrophosphatase YjhB (NUDIX family)